MSAHRLSAFAGCVLATVLAAICLGPVASAHEHVTVGEYELIAGWRDEPTIVGSLNGLDLGIEHHWPNGTTEWVVGAQITLNATLSTGPASGTYALEPQFGQPGWYTFDVIPTREGVYSVRIFGSLNATAVDVTVPLDDVGARSTVEFPVPDPTPADLQSALSSLQSGLAAARSENTDLRGQLGAAYAMGVAGILMGLVGLGTGALALRRSSKR